MPVYLVIVLGRGAILAATQQSGLENGRPARSEACRCRVLLDPVPGGRLPVTGQGRVKPGKGKTADPLSNALSGQRSASYFGHFPGKEKIPFQALTRLITG